jgi:hypothetical protein
MNDFSVRRYSSLQCTFNEAHILQRILVEAQSIVAAALAAAG